MGTVDRSGADVVVVGAGAAGLYAALTAAGAEGAPRVVLVSAIPLAESARAGSRSAEGSSWWAQGGLAAAVGPDDGPERHLADTLAAGRGAVRPSAARVLCYEAPAALAGLQRLGVAFDADGAGGLALGLEGGHSARRVAHAGGSSTGRRIVRQLSALAATEPRIDVREGRRAAALLLGEERCAGVELDDGTRLSARAVILATGGCAALWARTTNPLGATGSGLALAHAAGADLADLELMQFHPTAVATRGALDGFLITEAIRGEGARLLDAAGERFVEELEPRDVVARAVAEQLARSGAASVGLDMRQVDPDRFPNVVAALRAGGIDPVRELVPVAPAAHYVMGGIAADLDGRTSVPGLYAVGECACTGLHGANRLASNSLSECFVLGRRAALAALSEPPPPRRAEPAPPPPDALAPPAPEVRTALWRDAGIERTPEGLARLGESQHPLAALIARCALARTESRGAHRRTDRPERDPAFDERHVVLDPAGAAHVELWR